MKKGLLILSILVSTASANPMHLPLKIAAGSVFICVSLTGHKYHRDGNCHGLARCAHEIRKVNKAQAIKMGYSSCKICY
jgi:hypothetical protein